LLLPAFYDKLPLVMNKKNSLHQYQKEVDRIVSLIAENYQPEKIILFGSGASGKFHQDSDIDLLVIKDTNESYRQRKRELALMCASYTPKDIFVLTPSELEKAIANNRFLLTEEILPKGKVVYEKN